MSSVFSVFSFDQVELPVFIDDEYSGEFYFKFSSPEKLESIQTEDLVKSLAPFLRDKVLQVIKTLNNENGEIQLKQLLTKGIKWNYDFRSLRVTFLVPVQLRKEKSHSLKNNNFYSNESPSSPHPVAGYLNINSQKKVTSNWSPEIKFKLDFDGSFKLDAEFAKIISFHQGDFNRFDDYKKLGNKLGLIDDEWQVFYNHQTG